MATPTTTKKIAETKPVRTNYTPVAITAAQEKAWDMTRSALLWNCPAFSHILYTMMNPRGASDAALFTKDIETLATDGVTLMINPDYFFKHTLQERVFMTCHEILHNVFDHVGVMWLCRTRDKVSYPSGKSLPYDHETMNIAMDLVINAQLVDAKVGSYRKEWLYDTTKKVATSDDSVLDVYGKIFDPNKPKGGKGQGMGQGFDSHLDPGQGQGQDAATAQAARNPQAWKQAVAAAAEVARARGKLPSNLEKLFGALVNPQVPWQDVIQGFFNRKVGSGSYDWRRADRRLIVRDIYAPGRSGYGAGCVVVGFDTSGSIYAVPELLEKFISEVGGILQEVRPKQLFIVWCDAEVHRTDEVDELTDLISLKPVGGGGTDFNPVFDWIAENQLEPDALVYMTDGYGSFPKQEPKYPVLWADISNNPKLYPFGDVVNIPNK